jgi:hypothetical protein
LRFRLLVAALAAVYPRLPVRVRTLPREVYLRSTRKMLAKVKRKPAIRVQSA